MGKAGNEKNFSDLRRRAQKFLGTTPENVDIRTEDIQRLVQELDTYQVELELQNEDLRQAQEELTRSRRRYSDLYDFAPLAYLTMSDKGVVLEANLAAGELLGLTRKELLNRPFPLFIVPEDQDLFYTSRQKLLQTLQPQSYELRLKRTDGSSFHAFVEAVINTETCDLPGQFRVMVRDISARKEQELVQLRRMKNRYRAIVMDQSEMICRFDPEGRVTFVNDAYCRVFALDYWQILGSRFLPDIYEDDLPLVASHFKDLTRAQPEKTIEHRVWLPDGKLSWQQWSGRALFDEKGKLVMYQAVGRDITQLKETEQKLQKEVASRQVFLDALPCIALFLNYHTREIIAANKAAITVGGVPGEKCYATFAKRETPCLWCRIPAGSWALGQTINEQFEALDRFWDAYWIPVDGDHCLHYIFDITEKQKNRQALQRAHDELENRVARRTLELQMSHKQLLHSEKLAAAGRLSASIAHEFNSPLQSIQTILEGIGKYGSLEEKEQELVGLALHECRRMGKLIANLSDFFRPTSGKVEQVDIHSVIDSVLLLSRKDMERKNVKIVKQYDRNTPCISAVADQLKQVFLNLLSNAADACEGGGSISIITEKNSPEELVVHIKDSGIGINPANIAHLFEPFFTTKPELKGTGLGLSVSYGIIQKHGGRIDVKSWPGEGTRFSVFLPVMGVSHGQ